MIVLDTHTWIWLASDPKQLSKNAALAIRQASNRAIAAISCWELAMLAEKNRIRIDRDLVSWMEQSFNELAIELLPLTPAVAVRSTQLGENFHGDPADRIIVATSLVQNSILATKDALIQKSGVVKTVW